MKCPAGDVNRFVRTYRQAPRVAPSSSRSAGCGLRVTGCGLWPRRGRGRLGDVCRPPGCGPGLLGMGGDEIVPDGHPAHGDLSLFRERAPAGHRRGEEHRHRRRERDGRRLRLPGPVDWDGRGRAGPWLPTGRLYRPDRHAATPERPLRIASALAGLAVSLWQRAVENPCRRSLCRPRHRRFDLRANLRRDSGTEQLIASTAGVSYRRADPNPAIPTTVSSRSTE